MISTNLHKPVRVRVSNYNARMSANNRPYMSLCVEDEHGNSTAIFFTDPDVLLEFVSLCEKGSKQLIADRHEYRKSLILQRTDQ